MFESDWRLYDRYSNECSECGDIWTIAGTNPKLCHYCFAAKHGIVHSDDRPPPPPQMSLFE